MSEEASSDPQPSPARRGLFRTLVSALATLLRSSIYLLGIAWAAGAIYHDAPLGDELGRTVLAIGYPIVVLLFLAGLVTPLRRFAGWVLATALVVVPWLMIEPSNEGDWDLPWSRTAWAEINGDLITFHDFRNFDYALDGTVTERWEERTVHLWNLRGLDYFHHAFSGDLLAHPVLSFDFGDDGQVAFSIEVRREAGQKFHPITGLYRQFHLSYLVGDERDFIRERATIRDQPVRLYRASYREGRIRDMFFETVHAMNRLKTDPRFYHTVTANCTTSYLAQAPIEKRARLDYRLLLNGRIESLLYERRVIVTDGLPLEELRARAAINQAAREAHHDPEFSARIRQGRPGRTRTR